MRATISFTERELRVLRAMFPLHINDQSDDLVLAKIATKIAKAIDRCEDKKT